MFKPSRSSLPTNPGVYLYKNKDNEIIYIGKAKNLRNRVMQYFIGDHKLSPKTQFLVRNIKNLDTIVVETEVEALLLENKLIKKHKPKYNINLKDAKTYAYIKITDEKIPKIISTRRVTKTGTYFGPYTNGTLRRELIDLVQKLFKIVTPRTYSNKSQLNFDIGISPAPTLDQIKIDKYLEQVELAKKFLKGTNRKEILKQLKFEMQEASDNNKFELALEKKKCIEILLNIEDKQSVDLLKNYNQDVIVRKRREEKDVFVIFRINKGVISGKKEFFIEKEENIFENFLTRYYSTHLIPREILVNEEFWRTDENKKVLEYYLEKLKGSKTELIKPKRGERLSLVKIALQNVSLVKEEFSLLEEMREKLELPKLPLIIECFDMSNLGASHVVGGMTRWVNEKEDKDGHRRFEIKSFKGKQDDFAAMREVVYRRYKGLKEKRDQDGVFPDLILIDGGKGQLAAAHDALRMLRLEIPLISLAKREEEIFSIYRNESFNFDNNSKLMLFIRNVRDSVHRYVVNYNRKKREMQIREGFKR